MPVRDQSVDLVRVVEGVSGRVPMTHGVRRPLRLRQRHALGARRRTAPSASSPGPSALCLTTPVRLEGHDYRHTAEFTVAAGDRVPFVLAGYPSFEEPPPRVDAFEAIDRTTEFWQEWSAPVDVRRRLVRRGAALARHAQGAHLRADRRDRGRAHHVAARVDRRCAQLGLPVLLAPRRDVHDLLADDRRLHRRGVLVPRLAAARGGRRSRAPADHVRPGGRATPQRVRGRLAPGLRGLEHRCGSATPPTTSTSSTCTARWSTRCTRAATWASRRTPTRGRCSGPSSTSSRPGGVSPTRASGRSAATGRTSSTPR